MVLLPAGYFIWKTLLKKDEVEEEEADDEGTGAPHVDITSYFPEAQVSAGKVSEVLVSVKVKFHSILFQNSEILILG